MTNAATAISAPPEQERRSVTVDMANRYGMDALPFEATLRATVVPKECSREDFAAFLLVAREYDLNPITKEIYAFPKRGGGIQPIVSVDGWSNIINSHPQCDGFDFEDVIGQDGKIVSITCRMYRKDRSHAITATEYMAECERNTDTWKQWPRRMLRHKSLIQAARYAFGFAGIVDPDEAERGDGGHYGGTPGPRLVPPPAPSKQPVPKTPQSATALPGDWQDYLDRQLEELSGPLDANGTGQQGVHDAVADAIQNAIERGEISRKEATDISEKWDEMSAA